MAAPHKRARTHSLTHGHTHGHTYGHTHTPSLTHTHTHTHTDKVARPAAVREELLAKHSGAKTALCRVGGDFPFLRCLPLLRVQGSGFRV